MERLDAKACSRLREQLSCPGEMFLSGDHPAGEMTGVLRRLSMLVTSRSHATGKSFLFHTADKALGRKICNAMEEAYAGKEKIREKILRQVGRNREEIVRMGDFLRRYLTFRT